MKILLLLAFLPLLLPRPALASCLPPPPLPERIAQADLVLVGQVVSTSGQGGNQAKITVERYYRGNGYEKIDVRGGPEGSAATSVDMEFRSGERYLLFLEKAPSGTLTTNDCAGNILLDEALTSDEVNALGVGAAPTTGSGSQNNQLALGLSAIVILLILLRFRHKIFT